jgi:diguanylate cyclase (GGDEF)-like protein
VIVAKIDSLEKMGPIPVKRNELLKEMARTIAELRAFNEIGKTLTSTLNTSEVLSIIMEKISQLLMPTNWSLLLVDQSTNELYFEIVVGDGADKLKGVRIPFGQGIVGWVARESQPILIPDAHKDSRWCNKMDDVTQFETRSILCTPLNCRDTVLGVIEIVNAKPSAYTDADLRLLNSLSDFAAIAIENARNFQKVQELTVTDDVTRLYNTRFLHNVLQREYERSKRYGHSFAVVFLDLDHFKQVNDKHGHLLGSKLLSEVGELIRNRIRSVDIATRYGGDEFVIILPQTSKNQAIQVARRFRLALNEAIFLEEEGLSVRMTASFGVASYPQDASTRDDMLRLADEAMYRVKQTTRDGIQIAEPNEKHRQMAE